MAKQIRNTGCIACSGASCSKCRHWTAIEFEENQQLARGGWGVCAYYTENKGEPRRIYAGNIRQYPETFTPDPAEGDYQVISTSKAKCPHYEK